MRNLFISAAIAAGLVFGGVSTFANEMGTKYTSTHITQLRGRVIDINEYNFVLKDRMGKIHRIIPAEPSKLAKINIGEHVTVEMRHGRAVAINTTRHRENRYY